MPVIDMPLEKLREYGGLNPRPADFDAFWDAGLEEMHALDPRVELAAADFEAPNAECFDMHFTGVGGARVYAKYLRPKGAREGAGLPAVVLFHGYSGSSGDWFDKLAWVGSGFCVAALDCRGQGGRSEDTGGVRGNTLQGHIIRGLAEDSPEKLLFRSIFLDTAELARIVMALPEVDAGRVGATGGSQGGGSRSRARRSSPASGARRRCSRSSATTGASGRWTWPRPPTTSFASTSAASTRATSARTRSSLASATSTASTSRRASRPRS